MKSAIDVGFLPVTHPNVAVINMVERDVANPLRDGLVRLRVRGCRKHLACRLTDFTDPDRDRAISLGRRHLCQRRKAGFVIHWTICASKFPVSWVSKADFELLVVISMPLTGLRHCQSCREDRKRKYHPYSLDHDS